MNWYSVFSLRSVMGVALVMAGLAHAADIKLSETSELQAAGDLTYTFAAGDTFVVDAAFSPTSFKPICPGDFTMKVEGSGSIAATTALDFSAVSGALTLSGLGTTESSSPKQTSTAPEPAAVEPAPVQVTEDNATLTFAPVLLTAEAETVPTLTISEASATWSTGSWSSDSAPTSGEAVISATTDATLTIDAAVSLSTLTFEVAENKTLTIALGTGGSLAVTTTTVNGSGKVIAQGGTYGAVTIAAEATLLFATGSQFSTVADGGTVGIANNSALTLSSNGTEKETPSSRLLLREGTFRKEGSAALTLQCHNSRADAETQSIVVASGSLTVHENGGLETDNIPVEQHQWHLFRRIEVAQGTTFTETTKWRTHLAVKEALVGEGKVVISASTSATGTRQFRIDGTAADFTGTAALTGVTFVFAEASDGQFGGALSVEVSSNRPAALQVSRPDGAAIAKDLTLKSGVGLDLSAGGSLSAGGTLTLGGDNLITLSESAKAGDVLIKLTGEDAQANAETAEQIAVSTPGLFVAAQGANYVLAASPELSLSADGVWSTAEWTSGGSPLAQAPISGGAKVMTTANATLSIDEAVSLSSLELAPATDTTLTMAYTESETAALETGATAVTSGRVFAQRGSYGAVSVADDATLIFGSQATFGTLADGGTIGLSGSGTKTAAADSKALLFRAGTFRKEGEGEFKLQMDTASGTWVENVEVAGGTLNIEHSSGTADCTYTANFKVNRDTQFSQGSYWGVNVTLKGNLSGEGTVQVLNHTGPTNAATTRTFTFSGACTEFTGTAKATGVSIALKPSDSHFGGSLAVATAGSRVVTFSVAEGVTIDGDVTLGTSGKTMTLSLKGTAPTAKALTLKGPVKVSLPAASLVDGTVLFTLTGEAGATEETAALLGSPAEGYLVKAEGANYVLRKVTLPGVQPSEPGEEGYSTEAAAALTAAAEEARIAGVSQVLLQTKGAASASEPTVTEVNNVLGCFEGVVEADSNSQTLTIRYEFGVADIAADDSETPWNGKWQVKAKVEGPEGGTAAFVEGVTVAAYEVGEDGEIPADATPLQQAVINTPVNAVTLRGIEFKDLGTHGIRVRVKATK